METSSGHVTDFDFLHGSWNVTHRRLRQRWINSTDWDIFDSTSSCAPHLSGLSNIEQIDVPARGFSGLTIRLFNLSTSQWSIWWVNSNAGVLEAPVVGGFDGHVGIFFGQDTDNEQPIKVRFRWEVLSPNQARWEQAFSQEPDLWETNWIMDFTRSYTSTENPASSVERE
jgi:hypothetical protein